MCPIENSPEFKSLLLNQEMEKRMTTLKSCRGPRERVCKQLCMCPGDRKCCDTESIMNVQVVHAWI